jgi:hypothetical protein
MTFDWNQTPAAAKTFRQVAGLISASRCAPCFGKAKPSNALAAEGLRYERKIGRELQLLVNAGKLIAMQPNPWFTFVDTVGYGKCSPDFLVQYGSWLVIVEVKLHWVSSAREKLNRLYHPVVTKALGVAAKNLVICRNMVPTAPRADFSFREAVEGPNKLLHWPANGHLPW